jgi:hypothetical protein
MLPVIVVPLLFASASLAGQVSVGSCSTRPIFAAILLLSYVSFLVGGLRLFFTYFRPKGRE